MTINKKPFYILAAIMAFPVIWLLVFIFLIKAKINIFSPAYLQWSIVISIFLFFLFVVYIFTKSFKKSLVLSVAVTIIVIALVIGYMLANINLA